MKSKLLSFAILTLCLVSLASAFTISPTTLTFADNSSQTFTITNTNTTGSLTVDYDLTLIVNGESSSTATFAIEDNKTITNSSSNTITVTPTIDFTDFNFGETYSAQLYINNSANLADSKTLTVEIEKPFCDYNDNDNLRITIEDIKNNGLGEDDNWYLFDEIEIEVNVDNRGDEKIEDIEIEWCLFDEDSNTCLLEDDEKSFNLKDGNDETVFITFTLDEDIEDFEDGSYEFLVKATGDDTEFDPSEMTCVSDSDSIDVMIDNNFVILTDIRIPETIQCGGTLDLNADVWNIGDDNQDDVYVKIRNSELGIFQDVDIGDVDSLEDDRLSFSFTIPNDAIEKTYPLELSVYDDEDDLYESDNDDESIYTVDFTVSGFCDLPTSADLTAILDSEAVAGKDLIVKATISNTGTQETTYLLSVRGYEDWAGLNSISKQTVVLKAGAVEEFTINLLPNKDSEGEQNFLIQAIAEGNIEEQTVIVTLEESQGGFSGFSLSGDNWVVWAIAALNIILVLLIIVVAVRVSRNA